MPTVKPSEIRGHGFGTAAKCRAVFLVFFCLFSGTVALWGAARPNILFLFADDQRADTIAAHGNPLDVERIIARQVEAAVSRAGALVAGLFAGGAGPAGLSASAPRRAPPRHESDRLLPNHPPIA